MKKDKEWLKKEVRNAFSWGVNLEEGGMIRAVDMDYVIKLIDQLDEPEVLSEECGTIELEVEDNAEN